MNLPFELFVESIEERKIYFLKGKPPGNLVGDHFHVCLRKPDGTILYMVCCTSQIEKIQKFIQTRRLPLSTMVYLAPDAGNPFTKDTCVNCNNVKICSEEEFKDFYNTGGVDSVGEITEGQFVQILQGIQDSKMVETKTKDVLSEILRRYEV